MGISNKTLTILWAIFIVVSAIGIYQWRGGITGMATEENETGNVTANVVADIDINATDDAIDFGDVLNNYLNRSEDTADMNGTHDNITIKILGNTVTDIDYWANQSLFAKRNASTNINNIGYLIADESYQIRIIDNGTCGEVSIPSYQNVNITFANASNLISDCNKGDEFTLGIQIYVPQYEPAGPKKSTLYFRATEYTG